MRATGGALARRRGAASKDSKLLALLEQLRVERPLAYEILICLLIHLLHEK